MYWLPEAVRSFATGNSGASKPMSEPLFLDVGGQVSAGDQELEPEWTHGGVEALASLKAVLALGRTVPQVFFDLFANGGSVDDLPALDGAVVEPAREQAGRQGDGGRDEQPEARLPGKCCIVFLWIP